MRLRSADAPQSFSPSQLASASTAEAHGGVLNHSAPPLHALFRASRRLTALNRIHRTSQSSAAAIWWFRWDGKASELAWAPQRLRRPVGKVTERSRSNFTQAENFFFLLDVFISPHIFFSRTASS